MKNINIYPEFEQNSYLNKRNPVYLRGS